MAAATCVSGLGVGLIHDVFSVAGRFDRSADSGDGRLQGRLVDIRGHGNAAVGDMTIDRLDAIGRAQCRNDIVEARWAIHVDVEVALHCRFHASIARYLTQQNLEEAGRRVHGGHQAVHGGPVADRRASFRSRCSTLGLMGRMEPT